MTGSPALTLTTVRRRGPAAAVFLAVLLAADLAWAALAFPELTGRVVDEAGLLSPAQTRELTQLLEAHENATGNQVVVVTLDSLGGTSIEDYGYQLGRHWGIGQEDTDSGALLIVAPNERAVRIEVGYGLEGELTDAASKLIIENVILPAFRQGRFADGIIAGTDAIIKVLGGELKVVPTRQRQADQGESGIVPLLMFGLFAFFMVARRGVMGRRGRWGRRGMIVGGMGGMGGFGGRGGGGFGGGGFSGGGGGFGGGGASGGW